MASQGSFVADSTYKVTVLWFSPAHLPSPMSQIEKEFREGWSQETDAKGLRRSSSARESCGFRLSVLLCYSDAPFDDTFLPLETGVK